MPNKYFGDSQEALRMMIPLVINQRNIEAGAMERQKQLEFLKQKYEQETLQKIEEQKRAEEKAKRDFEISQLDKFYEANNQEAVGQLGQRLKQNYGLEIPTYFSGPEGVDRPLMRPKEPKADAWQIKDTEQGLMYFPTRPTPGAQPIPTGMQAPKQRWEVYPPTPSVRDERIPSGYRMKADGSGTLEPIPGGPADERNANKNSMVDRRRVTDERALRKDFMSLPEVKSYTEIKSQFNRLDEAMKEARTGGNMVAVDQALITILNKMLDPASVVRESEYARTPQDLALWNRIKGRVAKWGEGGAGLTNEDREAIATMAKKFYSVADRMYNEQVDYFTDLSRDYGYAPENIVRLGGAKGGYSRRPSGEAPKYKQEFNDADSYLEKKFGGAK